MINENNFNFAFLFTDTRAVFDCWILGDNFVKETYPAFEALKYQAERSKETSPLYMQDFYNVRIFENQGHCGVKCVLRHTINSLIDTINSHKILPKYLLVVLDKDLINDLADLFLEQVQHGVYKLVNYFVRQVDILVCRRHLSLLEKKPGVVSGYATKIIYVKMLRRIGKFHQSSRMSGICELRSKFNDALNDAVAKYNQYILTVNSCNTYDHFDQMGMLSSKGKEAFWYEIDDLIARFDVNKVKLLPNPKNPARPCNQQKFAGNNSDWSLSDVRRQHHTQSRDHKHRNFSNNHYY